MDVGVRVHLVMIAPKLDATRGRMVGLGVTSVVPFLPVGSLVAVIDRSASDLTAALVPGGESDWPERLRPAETLDAGLNRIAAHYLDVAIAGITDHGDDPGTGIHTARKALKRVRALLRLVRDEIGQRAYRAENVVLRDAGRSLAAARDGAVIVMTLDAVTDGISDDIASREFAASRGLLVDDGEKSMSRLVGDSRFLAELTQGLTGSRDRIAGLLREGNGLHGAGVRDEFAAIEAGLARTYQRGRVGLRRADTEPTDAAFHEWRKRVKYLRHQMETLHRLSPDVIGEMAVALNDLGELLGSEHDLTVLLEVARTSGHGLSGEPYQLLESAVHAARDDLRRDALAAGRHLYSEDGVAFVGRIGGHWSEHAVR